MAHMIDFVHAPSRHAKTRSRNPAWSATIENPSASFRFRDEGGVERHLTGAPTLGFNKMVRGRSTPVVFGGHFHVTRFGMFRSRAGIALNPWSTAASPRLPTGTGPFSTLKASSGQRLLHGAG